MNSNSPKSFFQVLHAEKSGDLFKYRPDIDGLRAIAVLAVIIYHLNQRWLPGGFTGVDIFFVISGYVVTASLIKSKSNNIADYLLSFYARRIRRILPALFACILITSLLTIFLVEPSQAQLYAKSAFYALIGLTNIYFAYQNKGYFDFDQELNPFLHTWSLGVEEQFYLIFPLILILTYSVGGVLLRDVEQAKFIFVGLLTISALISIALTSTDPLKGYFVLPSRFWELMSGAALFIFLAHGCRFTGKMKGWLLLLQILAVGLLGISLWATPSTWGFPFPWALTAVLGSVLFITVGTEMDGGSSFLFNLFSNSKLVFIGKISFSLYLWHWSVITLMRWSIGLDGVIKYLIAIVFTILLALLSYFYVEKPIRHLKASGLKRVFRDGGLALISCGLVISLLFNQGLGKTLYLGAKVEPQIWIDSANKNLTGNPECVPYQNQVPYVKTTDYTACSLTVPDTKNVYVLGDSTAETLIPMFKEISQRKVVSTTAAIHYGCMTTPSLKLSGLGHDSCFRYSTTEVQHAINSTKAGDIIFLGYLLGKYVEHSYGINDENKVGKTVFLDRADKEVSYSDARLLLSKDLRDIADKLKDKKASLVVLAPLPSFPLPTKICAGWLSTFNEHCSIERTESLAKREPLMKVLEGLERDLPNFYMWDPFDRLCATERCSQFRGKEVLFIDRTHLSSSGSISLAGEFIDFLAKNRLIAANKVS